jgi:orotidine-5'-phosphate decarboxylase
MPNDKGLIIALDMDDPAQARALVEACGDAGDFYKVAPTMTFKDPSFIPWLVGKGKKVFLDCKWYDIPSQVQRSIQTAGTLGLFSCTIHTSGASAMMKAALAASPRPRVWGVTVLTSFSQDDLNEVGVTAAPKDQVLRLAKLAQAAGLDGLVCSPHEAAFLRGNGVTLTLVTPGISFGDRGGKDQKRTAGPREAWSAGADYIVVGRSILESPNPAQTVKDILKEKP